MDSLISGVRVSVTFGGQGNLRPDSSCTPKLISKGPKFQMLKALNVLED